MNANPLDHKPSQKRSGVAGWITFAIAIVLVVGGMAALAGPGIINTGSDAPDFNALFATYFADLDAAQANGQIQAEGIYQNLKKKGEDAQAHVNAGERDKALNELNALINELNAQAGKQVAEPDASVLIADAQAIIDGLNRPADTAEPETATPAEDVTATPLDITESITVTSSPTPPPVTATLTTATPETDAHSVDSYTVGCSQTIVTGHFGLGTPALRATVNLASNLGVMLAEGISPRSNTGTFIISMTYPPQPEGTRLIVAVGEWDGAKFINPATLQGFDCTDAATGTGTPVGPIIAIAPDLTVTPTFPFVPTFPPPPSPTGGGRLESWAISQDVFLITVCNGAIGPAGPLVIASFLEFSPDHRLTAVILQHKRWQMFPNTADPNAYQGSYETADATQRTKDDISLTFTSDQSFTGIRVLDSKYSNGINDCHIESTWEGVKQP